MTAILDQEASADVGAGGVRFEAAPGYYPPWPVARTRVSGVGVDAMLSRNEMALALANSGVRLTRDMPVARVAALVVAGVRALGGQNRVRALDHVDRAHNGRAANYLISKAKYDRERAAWWPTGAEQEDIAHALAHHLGDTADPATADTGVSA